MRTTFTPAPDLEARLLEIVRTTGASMNSVVNEAVRTGLNGVEPMEMRRKRFKVTPVDLGMLPGIDPLKLRDVLNDLDLLDR